LSYVRVDSLDFKIFELQRKERFTIANGSSDAVKCAIVRLSVEGFEGLGASSANSVTGETSESIFSSLSAIKPKLVGRNFSSAQVLRDFMELDIPAMPAVRAGIDIAFHDALARGIGQTVGELLGGSDEPVVTDMTIGLMGRDDAVTKAKALSKDFRALKLKVGADLHRDIERVRSVREAVGSSVRLWCDANQGYDFAQAMKFADAAAELNIEFIEQPVAAGDIDALARLAKESSVPIMADESVKSLRDYEALLDKGVTHFNIKLMKCGGIRPACKIADLLAEREALALVGCMGESGVSLAGALHFASANPHVVKWADLDSPFMLARDVCEPLDFRDGMLWPKGPGTGVELREVF
jgi:L-alanine-DL-glutamate epimerase-like enolase superfamily enzyme